MGLFKGNFYTVVLPSCNPGHKAWTRTPGIAPGGSQLQPGVQWHGLNQEGNKHKHRRTPQPPDRCSSGKKKKIDKARKESLPKFSNTNSVAESNLMFVIYNPPGVRDSDFNAWKGK